MPYIFSYLHKVYFPSDSSRQLETVVIVHHTGSPPPGKYAVSLDFENKRNNQEKTGIIVEPFEI